MATNSEHLERLSAERKASLDTPAAGVHPVGGNPVPEANTAVDTTDPADVPSGRITSEGDAADKAAESGESTAVRRGTTTAKGAQSKT